ncbi:MAG TPA: endolytic transglycosylase MltG [Candidatus Kapabacteria bacterium]|nr:endolytic transglycosylase MltG [Candidatus Kapabacteria bacterium]
MIRKLTVAILLLLLICAGYFAYEIWLRHGDDTTVMVHIPEGSSFSQVLDTLAAAELIGSRAAFKVLAVTTGNDSKIKPGTYKFERGITAQELLNALVEGRSTVRVKVTFPEGVTIRRIASIAQRDAGCDSAEIVRLANDRAFLKSIGLTASSAEGYLMPDTYFIYWGEHAAALLRRMSDVFRDFYSDSLKHRAAALGLTPYQALTLASIVEGEARVDSERPVIAGVYLNRLHRGMKLEADPTIQYLFPNGPKRILYRDLEIDSPYNTYRYTGLPPTPINNPGRASIRAALNPASHDYIFFVARADGSGGHTFSRTAREHEAAVRLYRERTGTN